MQHKCARLMTLLQLVLSTSLASLTSTSPASTASTSSSKEFANNALNKHADAYNEPTTSATNNCPADFWPTELHKLNSYLDETVQPCEDFYEYSCGNWRIPYQLRALQARDALTALKASNEHTLINYFVQHWVGVNRTELMDGTKRAAYNFYESCLDAKIVRPKQAALKAYSDVLLGISDWPVLNAYYRPASAALNASFDWPRVSAELQRYGVHSFWRLLVHPNWQAAEQLIIYMAPLQFDSLPPIDASADEADDELFIYKRYIKYLMLDLNVRVREAKRIANEVVEFELALRALSSREHDFVLRAPQSLRSLQRRLPSLDLQRYFATFLGEALPQLRPDYDTELLIVADNHYLRRLSDFLATAKAETIGKYLLVQFLKRFEVHQHEHESYDDQKQQCLQQLQNLLPQSLTQLFLELQHESGSEFLQRTQQELQSLFEQLKHQFERMLNATKIFERDAVTKVLGLEKLRAMRLLLPSMPPPHAEAEAVEMTQDYDRNLLQLAKQRVVREMTPIISSLSSGKYKKLEASSLAVDSVYGPLDVNAFYRLKKNAIELPVGILSAPFYDRCLAPAKIFGSFVYIIAHELLHGFDYDGLNYDKSGNVANGWGAKSIIQFGNKSSCFMSARYPNAPRNINENIADSEGLRLALETFLESVGSDDQEPQKQPVESQRQSQTEKQQEQEQQGDEKQDPEEEQQQREKEDEEQKQQQRQQLQQQLQLFFISFAQTWCGSGPSNRASSLHDSHKGRVNNVVGNFPEFAEAFKCPTGSAMNPVEKCRIW